MSEGKDFIALVAKEYGDGAANFLGGRRPVQAVSTGSLGIDYSIGPYCAGFPLGQLSQVYGGEQAGKSLLCCQAAAKAQKAGVPVFLVDREKHYTPQWFERFGGDKDAIYDLHPRTLEDCFGMLEMAADFVTESGQSGGLFIIDSLQSLPTKTQFEDDSATAEGLAAVARFLSSRLGRYVERIWEPKIGLVIVGQIRNSPNPYASEREYTPGGRSLQHYSVLRLKMRHKSVIVVKEDGYENRIGFETVVTTVKNDVGGRAPGKQFTVKFYDGTGTVDEDALFHIARETRLLSTGGAGWFEVDGYGKFRGEKGWNEFIASHPDLKDAIIERAFDPNIVLVNETKDLTQSYDEDDEDDVNPLFDKEEESEEVD